MRDSYSSKLSSDHENLACHEIKVFIIILYIPILLILMMRGTSPIIAGRNTSGHGLISSLGLLNSMSEVDGWKPVSKEELILSNPDYVIVTKRTFKSFSSSEDFILKTGLNFTNAGKNNNLIIEDGMALLGFGPRTLDVGIKISEIIAK